MMRANIKPECTYNRRLLRKRVYSNDIATKFSPQLYIIIHFLIHYYTLSHPTTSLNWFTVPNLPLNPLESANSPYKLNLFLEHFFTPCFKEVCLDTTCSEAFLRKSSSVCLSHPVFPPCHSCVLSPISFSLLQKFLLLRAPANWMYSVPPLVSFSAKSLLVYNHVLNILTPGSPISLDHTLIIFSVTTFFTFYQPLLDSLPPFPAHIVKF